MIPVVFLHGIGGGSKSWAPQIASFASAGYQPVALDLPGYGGREPVSAMSFEALAEDVEFAISQNAALEKPVLVGHSMGGMVVQTMLRRKPDGYAAAVLSCTSPAFGKPGGRLPEEVRGRPPRPARCRQDDGGRRARAVSIMGPKPRSGRTRVVRRAIRRGAGSDLSGGRAMPRDVRRTLRTSPTSRSRRSASPPSTTRTRRPRSSRRWRARSPARITSACPASVTCRTSKLLPYSTRRFSTSSAMRSRAAPDSLPA